MVNPSQPGEQILRRVQLVSVGLLITFCIVVAIITFSPGAPDPSGQQALRHFLDTAQLHGLPWWITFGKIEFGANILMFVPIGLFGALALSRTRWLVVPGAILGSTIIEITQAVALPERV